MACELQDFSNRVHCEQEQDNNMNLQVLVDKGVGPEEAFQAQKGDTVQGKILSAVDAAK